jgi:hypothetical protein
LFVEVFLVPVSRSIPFHLVVRLLNWSRNTTFNVNDYLTFLWSCHSGERIGMYVPELLAVTRSAISFALVLDNVLMLHRLP